MLQVPFQSDSGIVRPAIAAGHKADSRVWIVSLVLVLATLAAYHRTFSSPFVFDDVFSIPLNSSIRQFSTALMPPDANGETAGGRPLVNLTLAFNYAISGTRVWSYHAFNLLIHASTGLVLLGVARRTLLLPVLRGRFGESATPLAAGIAALWLLHPLQTESVTYIIQRAESMMALMYLLTLYCFVRGAEFTIGDFPFASGGRHPKSTIFLSLSALCCLLGMACKEVMISAPLIVLLYDRAFVAGSIREAWNRRRAYYICLACAWMLLAWLAISTGNRGNTAGFGFDEAVSPWAYLLTQAKAIPHYLRLAVWPSGLTFDYGTAVVSGLGAVWPQALLVLALLGAAVWANVARPEIGWLCAFFFAVLAPSSSIMPIATQTMAGHRMYLPLAAVAALAALALWRATKIPRRATAATAALAAVLLALTINRNEVYRNAVTLWQDTVAKAPDNPRAHSNLSGAYLDDDKTLDLAIGHGRIAIALQPGCFQAHNNMGFAYYKQGKYDAALACYEKALAKRVNGIEQVYNNRGVALYKMGRHDEALRDFAEALAIRPFYTEVYSNQGNALFAAGRDLDALRSFDEALRQDPDYAAAWNNKGNVFSGRGIDMEAALHCYKRAVELEPGKWDYIDNVARLLIFLGRPAESVPYWREALPIAPDQDRARAGLDAALKLAGLAPENLDH